MLALEWAARYLGKDPSQLSSQICQVAILCRSFQIASTCTSLLAKFEAQFTTELLLTLVISCETAISHYTKCPGRTPHRPQDQFGAETCKAQLWIWKCKDPSLGKWRRNCKGVSRWKVRFMHEAWRYQWGLWQISNNTVASGFCIIHSGIHSYMSCLDFFCRGTSNFHSTQIPTIRTNLYKELSRDWGSPETNMNHESSGGIECSKHSLLHFVASDLNAKVWTNIHNQYPHCRVLTGQPELRSCDFQKTSTEISGKCGGHAWMINRVVLVNPVVGETERCQGEKDRSR